MNNNKFYLLKLKPIVIILTTIVLLIVISLTLNHLVKSKDNSTVLTINGEPVSEDEFSLIMSGLRANVFSYFSQKYGAKDNINFWTTSFNGEVPADILKQNTIDELKRIKIEQILMKVYAITDDISYFGFLKDFKNENERRKIAVTKNLPIFGPIQYEEKIYYNYLQSERTEKLKQILSCKELFISEEEIKIYYNENKEKKYRKPDYINIEKITLPVTNDKEEVSADKKAKAKMAISQIMKRIRNGEKFESVVSDYKSKGVKDIEYEEQVFDGSTLRIYTTLYPETCAKINDLKINQTSNIIVEKNSLNVIKIVDKKTEVYKTYEEVKVQIRKELINKKYEIMIKKLLDKVNLNAKYMTKMHNIL